MSENRILTTHVGSLPRPTELLALMRDKAEGRPYDAIELDRSLTEGVAAVVRQQVEIGIDLVSDGEFAKPSYATYVSERLSGFGGKGHSLRHGHSRLPLGHRQRLAVMEVGID